MNYPLNRNLSLSVCSPLTILTLSGGMKTSSPFLCQGILGGSGVRSSAVDGAGPKWRDDGVAGRAQVGGAEGAGQGAKRISSEVSLKRNSVPSTHFPVGWQGVWPNQAAHRNWSARRDATVTTPLLCIRNIPGSWGIEVGLHSGSPVRRAAAPRLRTIHARTR